MLIALAVVNGIQPGFVKVQSNLENRLNRIELYNHCRPMELVVEAPSPWAASEGVTEEYLRWAAEGRLREWGLYTDSSTQAGNTILYVRGDLYRFGFDGAGVKLLVDYLKVVYDPKRGKESATSIWSKEFRKQVYHRFRKTVREELPRLMDKFLVEYRRVNEKDCRR